MRLETLPKQLKFIAIFCLSLFSVLESVAQCDFNFIGGNTGCAPLLIKARHVPEPNVVSRDWDILDPNGNVVLNLPVNNNPSNDSLVSIFPSCGNFSVRLIVTYTNAPSCTIVK
ncbi:MAG: hypothetical protein JST49_01270, partial [Bacteroidetes bacterium]|nr:hypothetical protein [Bacteroidota bacterium]